ncbi:thioredoxin family protein [Niveibacterium sp.]|uniref:thioredoxin family protein n=1 Tax=Niveibacterium sp. TaxID=2017444 RepID=UPI0035B4416C
MKQVKVLGSGCANCRNTVQIVESVAQLRGVEIALEKVEDMHKIMAYGVMRTPAVVIDGKVVHAGGVPAPATVAQWFESPAGG